MSGSEPSSPLVARPLRLVEHEDDDDDVVDDVVGNPLFDSESENEDEGMSPRGVGGVTTFHFFPHFFHTFFHIFFSTGFCLQARNIPLIPTTMRMMKSMLPIGDHSRLGEAQSGRRGLSSASFNL